jgi:hypothetical protein
MAQILPFAVVFLFHNDHVPVLKEIPSAAVQAFMSEFGRNG